MSVTVCLSTKKTLSYPQGGGHLWVFLNWALGLRALGCEVIWLETVSDKESVAALKSRHKYRRLGLERDGIVERPTELSGSPGLRLGYRCGIRRSRRVAHLASTPGVAVLLILHQLQQCAAATAAALGTQQELRELHNVRDGKELRSELDPP